MSNQDLAFHYVCTWEKAKKIASRHPRFWVSNCGCREKRDVCSRSRIDLCLTFREDSPGSGGSGRKEISMVELGEIFHEAKAKHLVTRPFRNEKNMTLTDGICFCCDDCCEYFLNLDETRCDKGASIEKTEKDDCNNCGECVQVCFFGARKMEEEELVVNQNDCYGCGLCTDVCPEYCIQMVPRSQ